jgi:uncharacterized protein
MSYTFEWDENKDKSNQRKHGISFEEATSVFLDEYSVTFGDEAHSDDEDRYLDIGRSDRGRVIVVSYTEHPPNIRIISCRKATKQEMKAYEQRKSNFRR